MEAKSTPSADPTASGQASPRTQPSGPLGTPHRKPDFGSRNPNRPGQPAPSPAAGAVLLRRPDVGSASEAAGRSRPADWSVAPLPPSSVDNRERRAAQGQIRPATHSPSSVDNSDNDDFLYPDRDVASSFDDLPEDVDFKSDAGQPLRANVDNVDRVAGERPVRLSALKNPTAYAPQGRSGPNQDLVKVLREANKQRLVDRAKARGRDPGAGSKEVVRGVQRSEKTQQNYLARGNQLLNRYRRERGILSDDLLSIDVTEFADWVLSLKPTLKPPAWRVYKQSAKEVLATLPEADAAIAILEADSAESGSEPERKSTAKPMKGKRDLPRRTSAKKAKSISKPDFDRMVNFLKYFAKSEQGPVLADWLVAGIATGLRPAEWMATELQVVEDRNAPNGRFVWLYVLNAKATNGRANGAARTIDLTLVRDETIATIRRMSDRGRDWLLKDVFPEMQARCSQLMYSTADRLFPGRAFSYSLYTTRHQFIANAKANHPPEAVSALAGHMGTDTAIENYGKKRSAWRPEDLQDMAAPVPEEVETVKRQHTFFEERQKLREAAGLPARGFGPGEG